VVLPSGPRVPAVTGLRWREDGVRPAPARLVGETGAGTRAAHVFRVR
jgi:hypothetical protein